MTRVVVDTDGASYLFNWHSSAKALSDSLRGFELVLSFMTGAEMRTGAIAANWGRGVATLALRFVQESVRLRQDKPVRSEAQAGYRHARRRLRVPYRVVLCSEAFELR
jgi:predicted nucleic acid-binding protein